MSGNRNKLAISLVALCGTILLGYLILTQVSALVVLRWFVEEAGIPVEVRSASWNVNLKRLLKGTIDDLSVEIYYKPLKLQASLQTPVEWVHEKNHWSIRLRPVAHFGGLPPARGRIDLELEKKIGATVSFDLHNAKPLSIDFDGGRLSSASWKAAGNIQWNPLESAEKRWIANAAATISTLGVTLKNGTIFTASQLKIISDVNWPERPPLPLVTQATVTATGLQAVNDKILIVEPRFETKTRFQFDGQRFEHVDVSVDKPARLRASGDFDTLTSALNAKVSFKGDLSELVDERLSDWLENIVPVVRRAKAKGSLSLNGRIAATKQDLQASAELDLNAEKIKLPKRDLVIEQLRLKAPLSYPAEPSWGRLSVGSAEFHSVKLKNLLVDTKLSRKEISFTTESDNEKDRPIRQSVWGGTIDIGELYARVPFEPDTRPEFTASVTGGPFDLPMVQNDLCILPTKPLKGSLSFTYPKIVLDRNSLRLIGDTNLVVFNGTAHIGDMNLVFAGDNPKLHFSLDWNDFDLQAIGAFTNFGDMRGSLEGALLNTTMALTPIGPIPLSYDLMIRGRERGGKKIRFYGRAIDNILAMMGSPQDEIGPAGYLLRIATTWRNWMPATADYMGFRAKSDGEWTELSTFDPPESKKHYLLRGTAFTIPLNSHGVYPVLMKTDAFHGWLAGMIEYFKGRNKNESKQTEPGCTPLW